MIARRGRNALSAVAVSLPVVESVVAGSEDRAAVMTVCLARTANAPGNLARYRTDDGMNHAGALVVAGESVLGTGAAWRRPLDLARTSTVEREMANEFFVIGGRA